MARVSNEEKAKTHEKIINTASKMFRKNGIEATGVADIMKTLNLTHGGFYRHFASKNALVIEAIERAITESLAELISAKNRNERDKKAAIEVYIDRYLSDEHIENAANGCPLAALGTEAPHMSPEIFETFTDGTNKAIEAISNALPINRKKQDATSIMSTLIGSVILARMAHDKTQQKEILSIAKKSLFSLAN